MTRPSPRRASGPAPDAPFGGPAAPFADAPTPAAQTPTAPTPAEEAEEVLERFAAARARRAPWEPLWRECYDFALPGGQGPGDRRGDQLYDGTAADAVDQLAASLLAQLTPPWSRWFGLAPGPDLPAAERARLAPVLERAAATVQAHLDRSNFAVEAHQCYLDLATAGTACLLFEEAPPGEPSGFRFAAVPLSEAAFEEGPDGRLDAAFRRTEMTRAQLARRFPAASLPDALERAASRDPQARFGVVEAVVPDGPACRMLVVLEGGGAGGTGSVGAAAAAPGEALVLARARLARSPYLAFRWLKAPGEAYGRSPLMKALPDVRTANKVVELVLKNASIAVTGIWQADDDGVLNPATVRLVPGTIIPKAVGSGGLTPLQAPGRFDVSQLVLDDLRARIRHAMLVDRLGQAEGPRMTATEVIERSAEMARLLGATYGRLQSELLTPLVLRAVAILRRRGEIPDIVVDGRAVVLRHRSPLAQAQARRDAQAVLGWVEAVSALGPDAAAAVDGAAVARWLGQTFGVPDGLTVPEAPAAGRPEAGQPEAAHSETQQGDMP
jgi:hypothetical protein